MNPPVALPGPLFFTVAALTLGALSYLTHRWRLLCGLIAAIGCLALGWLSLNMILEKPLPLLVLDRSFVFSGREWALTTPGLEALTFISIIAGLAFLLALPASQGWSFYPFGLGVVAALVMAVTAQQHLYAVLFLWLAVILSTFVLSGGRPGATMGAFRYLALTSVGVMPLLILPRFLEPNAPGDAMYIATILMTLGFGILLMMVPFHGQLVAIAAYSAPMAPTFILSVFPPVVYCILFRLAQAHPSLWEDPLFFDVCRWMGVAAAVLGGLASLGQRQWGYLIGYATLVDWGAGLIALGRGTTAGMMQATQMLIWRAFSLLLVGAGWTAVFQATDKKDGIDHSTGLLGQRPLSVLALVLGVLSLAAFPLTPGAAGRWPLILDLMGSEPTMAWILILAGIGVSVGALFGLRACLGERAGAARPGEDRKGRRLEALTSAGFVLLALWLIGAFTLHPAPWLDIVQRVLDELALPVL